MFSSNVKKSKSITIKFKKKNQSTPQNINKVIELIPPAYRAGHTQMNMLQNMLPNSSYTIDFRDNEELAEKFATQLFKQYGNIFDIQRNYI